MSGPRVSMRVALALCVLAISLLTAAAGAAGYLVETHRQQAARGDRLAAAVTYVERGRTRAGTAPWQQGLSRRLAALGLGAALTLVGPPDGKRLLYNRPYQSSEKQPAPTQPTETHVVPLTRGSGQSLRLALYASPLDGSRRVLVALACGLAALLVGAMLALWAASRWLVTPLRRLNAQVDAVAGGDPAQVRVISPIREVGHVAIAVSGMAASLAHTAEQDARVEAERRLLVSSIAHDLRTPLFALRGYLDAIANGIGDPAERLDRARAKADQIDRLVTSLFDFARADIDRRPEPQTTALAAAVADATAGFELAAQECGATLRVTALTSPSVTIDRVALERALANVLDNALRHTPRGGTIDVTCGEDTDGAFVQVTDDGPGIAPALLPRLFEPIARPRARGDGAPAGAGLGLTIAARLLHHQGGTIQAANAPRRGACLTLRFPRAVAGAGEPTRH